MRFLSTFFASFLGTLVAAGIIFVMGLLFVATLAVSTDMEPRVRDGTVLHLKLSGDLPEFAEPQLADLRSGGDRLTVREVVDAVTKAAADKRVAALWLQPEGIQASWPALQEIRRALDAYSRSGKPLIASSGTGGFTEPDYFLASAADTVLIVPEGAFEFNGFFVSVAFYTELLRKLGVEPLIVRAGDFKGAVEPFQRKDLSPENELQLRRLVEVVDSVYVATIASRRPVSADELNRLQASGMPMTASQAREAGLVDVLAYADEVEARLKKRLGIAEDSELKTISLDAYARVPRASAGLEERSDGTIAVLYAAGTIESGSGELDPLSGETVVADEPFVATLDRLREDSSVDAVVLRIDSPGGSATASDVLWRALSRLRAEKPLVASFGGVAASGGYYIGVAAHEIYADPLTITGSIGVFGLMLNLGPALESKAGITFDGVKSDPAADMFSGVRSWDEEERRLMEERVGATYRAFLERVASGRGMDLSNVERLAGGRVWIGRDAERLGLVDELGGLDRAIEAAARRAGLEEGSYRLRVLPRPRSLLERLDALLPAVGSISGWLNSDADHPSRAGDLARSVNWLERRLHVPWTVEARLPVSVTIR